MTQQVERMLPLYEAKMVGAFNHRAADIVKSATAVKRQNQPSYLMDADLKDQGRSPIPAYWLAEDVVPVATLPCRLGILSISSPTNARTLVSALIPPVAVGHSMFLMEGGSTKDVCLLVAQMNSFALDFVARQKMAGLNMSFFYVGQFPFLPPSVFERSAPWAGMAGTRLDHWIEARVLRLTLIAEDMCPLAAATQTAIGVWDAVARERLLSELDAAMFHLFGLERSEADYVLESFPIVKRKDEAAFGTFRTKELILEVYDAMQVAIDSGQPYVSPFDDELSAASGSKVSRDG